MGIIQNEEIIKRYSKALFSIGQEEKKINTIIADLKQINELREKNSLFNKIILSPLISTSRHHEIFSKISKKLNLDKVTINFLFLLSINKRLMLIDKIYNYLKNNLSTKDNITNVDVIIPKKLNSKEMNKIEEKIKDKLNFKCKLNFIEDKVIISGFIIKYESKMLDFSLKSKLEKIKNSLE